MAGYTRNDGPNNISDGNVINSSDLDGEYDAIEAAFNNSTGHTHDGTAAEGAPIEVVGPAQDLVVTAAKVEPKTDNTLDLGSSTKEFKDLYIDGTAYIDGLGENILVATDKAIQFRDSGLSINSSADGQLDIDADTELELTAPTMDINASTTVTVDTADLVITGDTSATGAVDITGDLDVDNINIDGNAITSTDTNGDITISPNGTGTVVIDTDLDVDNININGNAITSTDTDGNIAITPNGTGEVDISKVDINSGAIDGVTIGGASAGAGTFTTLQADTSLNVDGTVTADGLTVDTDTLYVDATNNRVGIGTDSPGTLIELASSSPAIRFTDTDNSAYANVSMNSFGGLSFNADVGNTRPATDITFLVDNSESMRIDSSGNLLVGRTSEITFSSNTTDGMELEGSGSIKASATVAPLTLQRRDSDGNIANFYKDGTNVGSIGAVGGDPYMTDGSVGYRIYNNNSIIPTNSSGGGNNNAVDLGGDGLAFKDLYLSGKSFADTYQFAQNSSAVGATEAIYRPGTGSIAFKANSTERMRIDSSGNLLVGTTGAATISGNSGVQLYAPSGNHGRINVGKTVSGTVSALANYHNGSYVGGVTYSNTATAFPTSSDYRLKEDWRPMENSIDRVKALNPINFAWKLDGTRVDGFLAHEAQEVVPEAVTGEKDAVDADGNPEYQGIDQSKLVPLLTGALKEAIARIETLEAQVATLQGN